MLLLCEIRVLTNSKENIVMRCLVLMFIVTLFIGVGTVLGDSGQEVDETPVVVVELFSTFDSATIIWIACSLFILVVLIAASRNITVALGLSIVIPCVLLLLVREWGFIASHFTDFWQIVMYLFACAFILVAVPSSVIFGKLCLIGKRLDELKCQEKE